MRNTKRILSLFLVACMLVSCMATAVFAEDTKASGTKFSDVSADSAYATAVTTLNQMGVINGYEDGTFKPDQNVTRAEFTAMLMRTLKYDSLGAANVDKLPFTDLDNNDTSINWSFSSINIAYDKGIINGYEDSTFRPRNNVLYEEALKMIVCTLGYTGINVDTTPWYANYVAQANRLGITEYAGLLGAPEAPASRACIAQMLYDSLEVNICEDGDVTQETILSSYLGYVKDTGVITADGITSLSAPDVSLNADEIEVTTLTGDKHNYKVDDITLRNYLGHRLEFYYKTDGVVRELSFYSLSGGNELTLDASMIEPAESTNGQIRYYKSDSAATTTALNLDVNNVVIYNGKLYGSNAAGSRFNTSMIPKVGTVTLLDSNKDNAYDLINIQGYELYYVSTRNTSKYTIVDEVLTTSGDKNLVLDVENGAIDTKIVDAKGNPMSFSSISVGNIICLAKTNAGNGGEQMQTAVVVKESVTGKVTAEKAGESITVNGNTYEYSAAAPWMAGGSGNLVKPEIHDIATFYLDINGKIAVYKKDATSESVPYGYIMGIAAAGGNFADTKIVKILSQDNKVQDLTITSSTRVNGTALGSADAVENALKVTAAEQNIDGEAVTVQQVVKYTTRVADGALAVENFITAAKMESGQTITTDKLYYHQPKDVNSANSTYKYASTGNRFTNTTISSAQVSASNAIVFVVPSDRTDYEDYGKTTISSAFRNNNPYTIAAYDVSGTNVAKVIVSYGASAATVVDNYTPLSVVAQDIEFSSNKGENMGYLKGYQTAYNAVRGSLATWLSPDSGYVPEIGDIFRHAADKEGNATIEDKYVYYKVDGGNTYGVLEGGSSYLTAFNTVILGSVVATDEENISILAKNLKTGDTIDGEIPITFSISSLTNARVLSYDYDDSGKLTVNDVQGEDATATLRGMSAFTNGADVPTKVLVYLCEGVPKMIAVLGEIAD